MNFTDKIRNNLEEKIRIKKGEKILVALSGGADSMLLITMLLKLRDECGFMLYAFHLDHMYRGKVSYEDFLFVKKFCRDHAVPLFSYRRDISSISLKNKTGFEATARSMRYGLLDAIVISEGMDYIATAHHLDDNVESIFMHFVRGASLRGLIGMSPVSGKYIRPLINVTKEEILCTIVEEGIEYREDYTNKENVYTRNKIRNVIFPLIKEVNGSFSSNVIRLSEFVREENAFIEEYIEDNILRLMIFSDNRVEIVLSELKTYEKSLLGRLILRQFVYLNGTREDVYSHMISELKEICDRGISGKKKSFAGIDFELQDDRLIAEQKDITEMGELELSLGHNLYGMVDYYVRVLCEAELELIHTPHSIVLSREDFDRGLCLRTRKSGDFIYQKNIDGRKKIKKLYSELKLSQNDRKTLPLLCLNSEVYWVVGYRKSVHHYKALESMRLKGKDTQANCKQFIIISSEALL